ncbi:transporter [Nitrincola schmidtii]|uniref:transporter n=1 Tax=Nitrincola schmidtii TaxID=1730894 RepID=UPI00124DB49D|nr:transporter [Nitrincola schmidtii]
MKYTWCGIVILLPLSGWALAADTGIEGAVSQSLAYDDNFLFRQNAESSVIYTLSPQLTGYYRTPTYVSTLTAAVDIQRHSDFSEYDRSNPRLGWQQNWLRIRSAYNLGISYQEADQRAEAADDLGDFTTRSKVSTLTLAPSYQYQWSERDTVSLSFNYTDRTYSGDTTSNDNQSYSLNSGWSHNLNERVSLRANLGYTRFESEGQLQNDTRSDIWRVNTGVSYDWTERTSLTLLLGVTHQKTQTSLERVANTSNQTGTSVTLQWNHEALLNNYSASYTRDLVPSSDGAVREQDRLNLGFSRSLSDLSRMAVNASWLQSSDDNGSRDYFSLAPTYTREFTRDLSMNARYEYRWQKRSTEDSSIDGSIYRLNLVYKF